MTPSCTAFIILTANPVRSERRGADITRRSLEQTLGAWSGHTLTVIVVMLAFSSLIGNYYYGEADVEFLTTSRPVQLGYRMLVLPAVFGGALGSPNLVWNLVDVFMGVMALVNLAAKDPVYVHNSDIADPSGVECRQDSPMRQSAWEPDRLL
ncbi:alanine:cation symporter family protein [Nocardia sp. CA-145437]|uniref:alanine:cation symporter family protein n=1 Tax=Nocardia sp. CA-145437 TaxID=3239980 RepID=UPI003D962D74